MPPAVVKTIKDEIFWQYAKLISKSAGFGINQRAFQMNRFIALRDGKIKWSTAIREWIKEHEKPNECIYCGSKENLTVEHILPKSCGGPDTPDNAIKVCKKCNSSKGGKRLYEWVGLKNKDKVPRIAEGKYLKLLYKLHDKQGTLEVDKNELTVKLCPLCNMTPICERDKCEGKLTVYCLEGIFPIKQQH
ncbi:MAG: HNH endonuclease [Candidatus Aenigmarchaeota archaeon]|nr:HNH endonuclease [Candidatus Aenigmarchaeota archaeon]